MQYKAMQEWFSESLIHESGAVIHVVVLLKGKRQDGTVFTKKRDEYYSERPQVTISVDA